MKKLLIPVLTAGLLLTAAEGQAVDFRAKGVWINMLEYGDGGSFVKRGRDGGHVTGWGRWGEDHSRQSPACACNWMPWLPNLFPARSILK